MTSVAAAKPRIVRTQPQFRWPGGRHVAIIFNIAYEAWSEGKAPGIGPMGNPLPAGAFDSNALSWGNYGSTQGIERLLRVLDRTKTRASIMVSGVLAERYPDHVRAIVKAGHEYCAHSWAQDVVPASLSPEEDEHNIKKTTDILTAVTGLRPRGWISPRGTPSESTVRNLVLAGYEWHSDVLDGDRPYVQRFDAGDITAIPFTMDINDLPHAMRFGRTPQQFVDMFDAYLAHTLKADDGPIIIDVTAHGHCYGRPGGAWAYEEIARKVAGRDDVWFPMRQDVTEHMRKFLA
ncbi:MAG TPA: polysaccharide deacetylase family protein [Pseudolabrys sp.]|nr:polysaccharide deacetylase family protein [Pseudolabrys sp.]